MVSWGGITGRARVGAGDELGGFADESDVGCCEDVEAFAFFEFWEGAGGVGGGEEEVGADGGGPGAAVELVLVGD